MNLSFIPDRSGIYNKKLAEKEFSRQHETPFVFKGPGWYLRTNADGEEYTILATPLSNKPLSVYYKWNTDTEFRFFVFDSRNAAAIFTLVATYPKYDKD